MSIVRPYHQIETLHRSHMSVHQYRFTTASDSTQEVANKQIRHQTSQCSVGSFSVEFHLLAELIEHLARSANAQEMEILSTDQHVIRPPPEELDLSAKHSSPLSDPSPRHYWVVLEVIKLNKLNKLYPAARYKAVSDRAIDPINHLL